MHQIQPNQDYRDQTLRKNTALSADELKSDAAKHYDDCYHDYLFAWCNHENLALHYGYWDDQTTSHHQALINKNQLLYDLAKISADDHVLDAGCGIGGSAIWMAKHHNNRVTAITISKQQVKHAQQHAKRQKVADNINFEVADFCATHFEDESFDIVWGLESVCHALNKGDFLKEAYRLLLPGGKIIVCDGYLQRNAFNDDEWQDIVTCLNGWAVPNLCLRKIFTESLEKNNFQEIVYTDITAETLPSADYMLKVANRLKPVQKISQWLGLRSKAQTANFKVGIAQHRLFIDNIIEYGIFTATKPLL
ncbi:MAG: methyltransferase domain-containing protein [Methylococcales symbiont of Iophon sp. n. MRB-2018]|nr:MAG: methyltransferase domain-containing protein [Methylococcales symbiont of Iophon sp. n. MRB-2018]KAF3978887.1 MAG: methyltransferase domain-containing protein [Methylococcales symbiont of Iophon sp. n. MRB-2018]